MASIMTSSVELFTENHHHIANSTVECMTGNCTDQVVSSSSPYTPIQATLIGISAGLLSVVTITGNLMVMISFKMDKQLQTISNYFLFSLAVADIIIGLMGMPLFTLYLIQQQWTLGRTLCDTWLSVDYLSSNASVMNLLVISFDRYFSVTRPLTYRARRTTRKAALMIFSAWAISAIVWPPSIVAWPYIEGERTVPSNECYIQFIYSNEYMSIVTTVIAFWLPISVMIGLYVRVWYETVKRQRELVHLQAGKKASSKRSDSSEETGEEGVLKKGGRGPGIRAVATSGWKSNRQNSSGRSKDSQEITYVPTSVLKGAGPAKTDSIDVEESRWATFLTICRSCIDPEAPLANTPGGESCGGGAGQVGEDHSSEGYTTPRSLETPVQPTSIQIRDPYASMLPTSLRHHNEHFRQQQLREKQLQYQDEQVALKHNHPASPNQQIPTLNVSPSESIYTILIRLPPRGSSAVSSTDNGTTRGTSIQMMVSEPESKGPQGSRRNDATSLNNNAGRPQVVGHRAGGRQTGSLSPGTKRRNLQTSAVDDISKLPLDARLVPKQLVRGGNGDSSALMPQVAALNPAVSTAKKTPKAKKTSEKKQERKAAKTLSAILLAFIITWTPYNVLAVLKGVLGKESADNLIPNILWEFSYYLCYINSTINPVLYALCNASFRRTYVRILTCRWRSHARQPFNRYYYG